MSLLNKSTKLAAPIVTGSTVILLGQGGRQTSHQTTSKISTSANKHMSSLVQTYTRRNLSYHVTTTRHANRNTSSMSLYNIQNKNPISHGNRTKNFSSAANANANANTNANANAAGRGFVHWYEGHLKSHPVITKSITGSILWGLGDLVAQMVPTMMDDSGSKGEDGENKGASAVVKKEFEYDFPRTARAIFFGFAIHAPLSHLHFNFLEWMTVRGGFAGLSAPIFKTVTEQFVYWSWISNTLYHGAMSAMQGKTLQQTYDRIEDVLMDTQIAQWKFWIPVQLLNFRFVPVRHQLNVVLVTSVVWTALLSAWYPPEEEERDGVDETKKEGK